MSYNCKILLDSISETGKRITTFELTFPRIVLAEFNTHRMFSRNSASSRAIPFKKQIERVNKNPFIPEKWPMDGKGMQPNSYLSGEDDIAYAREVWLDIKATMVNEAFRLYNLFDSFTDEDIHIHKQLVNRLLEPFQWHTVIVTATEFDNFFKLRCDENAQYEIRRIADLMYEAYHAYDNDDFSERCNGLNGEWSAIQPQKLKIGEWHCPLVSTTDDHTLIEQYLNENEDVTLLYKIAGYDHDRAMVDVERKISVARCARVSYLTHDGKRDIEADLNLYERLLTSGHMSPFEHVATPFFINENTHLTKELTLDTTKDRCDGWQRVSSEEYAIDLFSGNFIGWQQLRKTIQGENCINFRKEEK